MVYVIIGVIGPDDSLKNIMQIQQELDSDIHLQYYSAFTVRDTLQVLNECQANSDGILFTGCAVYDIAVSKGTMYKPHNYVLHDTSSFYFTLLKHYQQSSIPRRVSSDARDAYVAQDALSLAGIEEYYAIKYKSYYTEETYIQYHLKNWNAGLVDVVFTSFAPVYEYFLKRNIPVCRLFTTFSAIRNAISHLSLQIKLSRERDMKIAVQLIRFSDEKLSEQMHFDAASAMLTLQQAFLTFVQSVQGTMIPNSAGELMIFSNKGNLLKRESKNMLSAILAALDIPVCSGIGIGKTPVDAEYHARKALALSAAQKDNTCYILYEDGMVEGPLLHQNYLKYNLHSLDEKIKKLSEETGLNASHVKKLQSLMTIHGINVFTSKDLGEFMGISERSANRILKQLLQSGKAEIVSKEMLPTGSGRPRNMIKILF